VVVAAALCLQPMAGTQLPVLVAPVVAVMVDKTLLEQQEPQTEAVVGVVVPQMPKQVEQAAQVSSSLNTFPNLIIKSSKHQAHGLLLPALLRSST
jgi:hypothetical protein